VRVGAAGLGRRIVTVSALACLAGCGSSGAENRAFRAEVQKVLRQVPGLESRLGPMVQAREEADSVLARFTAAVSNLPTPRDRKLRYLVMRLNSFGGAARDLLGWGQTVAYGERVRGETPPSWHSSSDSMMATIWEGQSESVKRYCEALRVLAAAERVCLGTSMLEDQEKVFWLGGVHDSTEKYMRTSDSVMVAAERFVRSEVAKLR
jgi:hypothetical protein